MNTLFMFVNFLKCFVTEVVLFSLVAFKQGFLNIMIFSKMSKYRKYHDIFSIYIRYFRYCQKCTCQEGRTVK